MYQIKGPSINDIQQYGSSQDESQIMLNYILILRSDVIYGWPLTPKHIKLKALSYSLNLVQSDVVYGWPLTPKHIKLKALTYSLNLLKKIRKKHNDKKRFEISLISKTGQKNCKHFFTLFQVNSKRFSKLQVLKCTFKN